MADISYAYACGAIKAREQKLLKKNDIEQMISQKNIKTLISFLENRGFGASRDIKDIDELIRYENEKLWEYLYSIVPEKSFFDIFLIENDFHNFKAVLKGIIRNINYDNFIIQPTKVDINVLKKSVEEKKFDILPEYMKEVCKKSFEVLTQSKDTQLSDGIIDKGCMQAQLEIVKNIKSDMLVKYFSAMIFYKNTKIAIRGAKTKKEANFFKETMCNTEELELRNLIRCAANSVQNVLDYIEKLGLHNSYSMIQSYKESPSEFEKQVDNYLMSIVKEYKYVTLGCEPIVSYYLAKQCEFLQIQLIAFGIRTNKTQDEIRGRLRSLYE